MGRVLVVDSEESQVRSVVAGLLCEGFEVAGTDNAHEVLDILQSENVDLVLIDLMMPGLHGIELARMIREACPTVRVVLTSAYHLSENQLHRADCGVVGFVPKPFEMHELADFIRAKISVARPSRPPRRRSGTRIAAMMARSAGAHREQVPLYP
jgi:DNA-binding response OmpR family regulator